MTIFLVSLGVLFAASVVGYLVVRLRSTNWGDGTAELPSGLWLTTAILVALSVTIQLAWNSIRIDQTGRCRVFLVATLLLGIAFLVGQAFNWQEAFRAAGGLEQGGLYLFTFVMLTGLHGLHVVGGIFLLGWVVYRAFANVYNPSYHPGVTYSLMYWHFLDVVWIILVLLLVLLT